MNVSIITTVITTIIAMPGLVADARVDSFDSVDSDGGGP